LTLFSMAGVPPFTGFLTKLFLLNIILNQKIFYFYFYFFLLLFLGLYFYVQNMRFLHSTSYDANPMLKFSSYAYTSTSYAHFSVCVSFMLIFGVLFIDDALLFFLWVFY
jgi:NADH:ubiquinone oxidoreductase subunit 2 (subunit N)